MKRLISLSFLLLLPLIFVSGQENEPADPQSIGETDATDIVDETNLLITDQSPGTADEPQEGTIQAFGAWDFIRMLLILGAVIGAIYLVFFFIKRSSLPKTQDNDLFRVLSTQIIANNRSLHLVEVGRKLFLIGAGEGSVTLISEIEDKETIDEIRLRMSERRIGEKRRFSEVLFGAFQPVRSKPAYQLHMNSSTDFIKKQRERLKNL